jgi:hypothetical protein
VIQYRTLYDFVAFVKQSDYEAAANGDREAKQRIADELDGVDLYFHGGPLVPDDYIGVTIADLLSHAIIPRVTLHKDE